ncbi:ABC transporter ATP-binding protein [Nakamurella antarctica]|uniref:ABC transporter ATP-binding protein n=1 Tax=Nakamurella antarctica TaxID=1902245 RepID=A0A3G9A034_9ACTN|nr:ABC transporter ATP-binding protein [Nakamurella antarctica]
MSEPGRPASTDEVSSVRLVGLTKKFGAVTAVDGLDLDIADGEFFAMLGPSGSGKTTVLRMIAGFEAPTAGAVLLDGTDVTKTPPFRRDVNTVFQDYALFPHMNLLQNVAYGLRVKGVKPGDRDRQAAQALDQVQLGGMATRRPHELSGGQRQRVALARALINRPRVLLLDEPLGALDLQLRQQMQVELKSIQREAGITFIFVTHDQEEALTLCDRVAVFSQGKIEQVGTGIEVYERPVSRFVANFVGTATVIDGDRARELFGTKESRAIRAEKITLEPGNSDLPELPAGQIGVFGTVAETVFAGIHTRYLVDVAGLMFTVLLANDSRRHGGEIHRGETVRLSWHLDQAVPLRD